LKLVKREDIESVEGNGKYITGMTDGVRTIIGSNGLKSAGARLYMECTECKKDPEMYREGIFLISRDQAEVFGGCGCTNSRLDEWQNKLTIERLCEKEGYKFHGWVGEYLGKKTKLDIECPEGYRYQSTNVTKFVLSGRRCPHCAGNIPWDLEKFLAKAKEKHGAKYDYSLIKSVSNSRQKLPIICKEHGVFYSDCHHHIQRGQECPDPECCWDKISRVKASNTDEWVSKVTKIHGNRYDYSDTIYDRSFKSLYIKCNKCGNTFKQVANDHLAGCGCTICSGDNQLHNYIFTIYENGLPIAIKAGIANDYRSRFRRQNHRTDYEVKVFGVWEAENTEQCKALERFVQNKYSRKVLTKREYPDGYEETFRILDIDNIIADYEAFGSVRFIYNEENK